MRTKLLMAFVVLVLAAGCKKDEEPAKTHFSDSSTGDYKSSVYYYDLTGNNGSEYLYENEPASIRKGSTNEQLVFDFGGGLAFSTSSMFQTPDGFVFYLNVLNYNDPDLGSINFQGRGEYLNGSTFYHGEFNTTTKRLTLYAEQVGAGSIGYLEFTMYK